MVFNRKVPNAPPTGIVHGQNLYQAVQEDFQGRQVTGRLSKMALRACIEFRRCPQVCSTFWRTNFAARFLGTWKPRFFLFLSY